MADPQLHGEVPARRFGACNMQRIVNRRAD
jgi:hypothetical protein